MMSLVTITGADDAVDPRELFALSQEFRFVEWGILVSETRAGEPRYPTQPWMERLLSCGQLRLSAHYCGRAMRDVAVHCNTFPVQWARRVQLNGWSPGDSDLVDVFHGNDITPILQCRDVARLSEYAKETTQLDASGIRAEVLVDPSGGTGRSVSDAISVANDIYQRMRRVSFGIAGGIGPDNIKTMAALAVKLDAAWIDMESGVRAEDAFDLKKVREVLEQYRAFMLALVKTRRSALS